MLEIVRKNIGEVVTLTLSGRIDAINAPELQAEIDDVVNSGQSDKLILRLQGINYLSAAGLRVLNKLKKDTGRVCISEPSDRVRDVMQITGLDVAYEIYDTLTQAIHATHPVINAHTHLELGWLKAQCPDVVGEDFAEWMETSIRQQFRNLRKGWEQTFTEATREGIKQMQTAGISTVGDISETGLSIQPLLDAKMSGVVYIELHGRDASRADQRLSDVKAKIEKWRPKMTDKLRIGLSLHSPYTIHRTLWEKGLDYARKENIPLCIHVAEHPAESEYMQHGTGQFADVLFKDSAPIDIPAQSPVAFLESVGALELKPLLIHAVQVSDEDIALIKKYGCTVVHCPRSNLRLQCGRMPLERFLDADIPVLMGTDSLASSPSLNVFEEAEVAVALHYGKVEPQKVVSLLHGALPH